MSIRGRVEGSSFVGRDPTVLGAVNGIVCVAVVALVMLPLQDRLTPAPAAAVLFVPVVIAAILGRWPAALATAAAGALVLAIVLPPYWVPTVDSWSDQAAIVIYAGAAIVGGAALGRWATRRRRAVLDARVAGASGPTRKPGPTTSGRPPADPHALVPLRPLNAFFGHHKAGTSWIGDILTDLCAEVGWTHWALDNAGPFGPVGLERWAFQHRVDVVSWTNADITLVPDRADLRAFHVIRDPRDVCISAYFSHRNSHPITNWPQLAEVREHLRRVDQDEGIAFEIDFLSDVFAAMEQWDYHRATILELRFEDLIADPERHFVRIGEFMGMVPAKAIATRPRNGNALRCRAHPVQRTRRALHLPPTVQVPAALVRNVVGRHSFETKSGGRRPGTSDPMSHYRVGIPGDWRRHFTAQHVELFNARYPTLVATLGYPAT